jgi:hypothetical protein
MPLVGAAFLLAAGRALAPIRVEYEDHRRLPSVRLQSTGRAERLGEAWVFAVRSRGLGVCPGYLCVKLLLAHRPR